MDTFDAPSLLAAHAILSVLACLDKNPTYNLPIIVALILLLPVSKIAGEGADGGVKLFQLLFGLSIILDITWLGLNGVGPGGAQTFAAVMTIFSLIFKPLTFLTLNRSFGNVSLPTMSVPSAPTSSASYQQI